MSEYVRSAQQTKQHGGVELYRRRFYLSKEALDSIDSAAATLGISPSEYVSKIAVNLKKE